ncbi:MAG: hypothetical protein IOC39_33785 [Burkholderia sp.]|jgi:hypothetical protein|uniref:hypothetical protein n=2 Tax=Burkholderia sp. TaxID=36773 RepID=UPI00258F95B6|nr:hypothetical protein [Burkholderia sp.]MCA3779420.1 hypothetical protein [Burkholderia sp.]MCA3796618.1 hypothetical protein [Burkholderia sp.]MCA3804507.1 hypothetical protein [Burkholderia sp.]MCA3811626.1 hypothetical protein [Burkholderia sp.]MCA3820797.1 hypothetical protein [Burkholderia sp.]
MTPVGKSRDEPPAAADVPDAGNRARRRSTRQTLAVFLLALGVVSVCAGLYSLIQAFDVLDVPIAFKVWMSRAVVAIVIGWISLHAGGKCAETIQGNAYRITSTWRSANQSRQHAIQASRTSMPNLSLYLYQECATRYLPMCLVRNIA